MIRFNLLAITQIAAEDFVCGATSLNAYFAFLYGLSAGVPAAKICNCGRLLPPSLKGGIVRSLVTRHRKPVSACRQVALPPHRHADYFAADCPSATLAKRVKISASDAHVGNDLGVNLFGRVACCYAPVPFRWP